MPTVLTRVIKINRTGSTDLTVPPLGTAGSQAIAVPGGDLVKLVAGAVTAIVAGTTLTTERIAAQNTPTASGVIAGVLVDIEKFDDDSELELPFATVTDTAANATGAVIGSQVDLRKSASGVFIACSNSTANPKLEILRLGTTYPLTDNFNTVVCRVLPLGRLA